MAPLIDAQTLPMLLFLAGTGLMIAEAIVPGAHFIVIGIALFVAGLAGMLFGPLASPFALAAMVLGVGLLTFYVYREFDFYKGTDTGQTKSSNDLRGARARVTKTVTSTSGSVRLLDEGGFDPNYSARSELGDEIPVGTNVYVTDPGGGNILTVMAAEAEDEIDRELRKGRDETDRESENELA
ncbi:NfeD family protein [Haloarchaeobius sp. DFWS5]|uniref:NfeD family protein n=1 Tax=Haloarchaeobius sp. DFWS5 TaxID=3446114 RepID=UPI003EBF0C50